MVGRVLRWFGQGAAAIALVLTLCFPAGAEFLGDIGGKELRDLIDDQRGKVVVVNFWATWCAPCREEFPHLKALRTRFPQSALYVTGVSLDFDPQAPVRFDAENMPGYPLFFAKTDVPREFAVGAIPHTLVYGPDGELEEDHLGVVTEAFLLDIVQRLAVSAESGGSQ